MTTPSSSGARPRFEGGSFRDPDGRVFRSEERILRTVSAKALDDWHYLCGTSFFAEAARRGQIVATRELQSEEIPEAVPEGEWASVLEHERIPFVSYPFEWSFGMLRDAALLELDLLLKALQEDLTLKDATPYNVQWMGSRPIHVDILSFEIRRDPGPWEGYRQFCSLFLFPLLLQCYKDVDFHPWLRGNLRGIDPLQFSKVLSARDLFRRGVFLHVYLHAKAQARYDSTDRPFRSELKTTGFSKDLIVSNARRLRDLVASLRWNRRSSEWSDYVSENSYDAADKQVKQAFVRGAVDETSPALVWDLGANTGTFSRIASRSAKLVLAMDSDHLAVEQLYQMLKAEDHRHILPLKVDLSDPSPNLGWRGLELKDLQSRGKPDLTLCLALVHHVVIGANVPLGDFVDWLADLEGDLVVEWVGKNDPMVKRLLLNRKDVFAGYRQEEFERLLSGRFRVVRKHPLGSGHRTLYFAVLQ